MNSAVANTETIPQHAHPTHRGRRSRPQDSARPNASVVPIERAVVARWMKGLHDEITAMFQRLETAAEFREDAWERPGGGLGVSRQLVEGATFERAGVNRFEGGGELLPHVAQRLGARTREGSIVHFYATGVSVVAHPRSPLVPSVHLNVRYFELEGREGELLDAWFGGGSDLTPTYPFAEDAAHFHREMKAICDQHHPLLFPRFKAWCDDYFVNHHRDGERRGVGGIFFDHLRADEDFGLDSAGISAFTRDIGRCLESTYAPIVERRRDTPYGDAERQFQLFRRGRYAEFNLIHDRGTLFGLQTHARVESVLMSMPPMAAWQGNSSFPEGSFQAEMMEMLKPRDWASAEPVCV